MVWAPSCSYLPPTPASAASIPPKSLPSKETCESASMWVPTWVPVLIMSLAALLPSERTMSPWRRGRLCQKCGWLGDWGMPTRRLAAQVDHVDPASHDVEQGIGCHRGGHRRISSSFRLLISSAL